MKKLAIIDKDKDILRIIPLSNEGYLDFKFSLRENHFIIKSWELRQKSPQIIDYIKSGAEITYHSSQKEKNPVVHIKYINYKPDVWLYKNISSKIIDVKLVLGFQSKFIKLDFLIDSKITDFSRK